MAEKDREISKLKKEQEDFKKKIEAMDAEQKAKEAALVSSAQSSSAKAQKKVRIKLPTKK